MGNHTQYGFAADYTGAMNSDQSARYRVVTSYGARDGDWDLTKNEALYVAPSFEWDISERTRLSILTSYHRGSYAYPSAYDANWTAISPSLAGYSLNRGVVFNDGKAFINAVDNRLAWDYKNDWLKNTVVVGTDYRHSKVDALYTLFGSTSATNVINATSGYGQAQNVSNAPQTQIKARQLGFYLQNNARIADKYVQGLGVRHDRVKQDEYTSTQTVKDNHTSYAASFMYEGAYGLNPYFSYSESFNLPMGLSGTQTLYDPNITRQYKVGLKYVPTWLDATITIAGFRAKDKGALVASSTGMGSIISSVEPVRRKGVEVQIDTNITDNWNTVLAYTYLKSYTETTAGNVRNALIPTSTLAAKTTYSFKGVLDGLTIGAGVRYLGHSVTAKNYSVYSHACVPSATVVDLMARYTFNNNWTAQVNVDNVENRRYIAACDTYCYYGQERKINGSLSYKF
ncbi:TonB-dependent siderophore receptor [Mannheimia sp. E30BD]|uniref:TonB-dependent siderophore receptor n=1 Tax=Mannheimia sp. E30BD TaxID=3278708 RepID=UPI00359DAFEB